MIHSEATQLSQARVLIIDDKAYARRGLCDQVNRHVAHVETCGPADAMRIFRPGNFSHLVVDLRFDTEEGASAENERPEESAYTNGVSLVQALLQDAQEDVPQIIFITGSTWGAQSAHLCEAAQKDGRRVFTVLTKSPDAGVLLQAITQRPDEEVPSPVRHQVISELRAPSFPPRFASAENVAETAEIRDKMARAVQLYDTALEVLQRHPEFLLDVSPEGENLMYSAINAIRPESKALKELGLRKPGEELLHEAASAVIFLDPEALLVSEEEVSQESREKLRQVRKDFQEAYELLKNSGRELSAWREQKGSVSLEGFLVNALKVAPDRVHIETAATRELLIPDADHSLRKLLTQLAAFAISEPGDLIVEYFERCQDSVIPSHMRTVLQKHGIQSGFLVHLNVDFPRQGETWESRIVSLRASLLALQQSGKGIVEARQFGSSTRKEQLGIYIPAHQAHEEQKSGEQVGESAQEQVLVHAPHGIQFPNKSSYTTQEISTPAGKIVLIGYTLDELRSCTYSSPCFCAHDSVVYVSFIGGRHAERAGLLGAYLHAQEKMDMSLAVNLARNAQRAIIKEGVQYEVEPYLGSGSPAESLRFGNIMQALGLQEGDFTDEFLPEAMMFGMTVMHTMGMLLERDL